MGSSLGLFLTLGIPGAGCSKKSAGLDAEDVAWATGWKIRKFQLRELDAKGAQSIELVMADEENRETSLCSIGDPSPSKALSPDTLVRVALLKENSRFHFKLNGVSGVTEPLFEGKSALFPMDSKLEGSDLALAEVFHGNTTFGPGKRSTRLFLRLHGSAK